MSVNFKQLEPGDKRIVQWHISGWHLRQSEVCADTWDSQKFVIVYETVRICVEACGRQELGQ